MERREEKEWNRRNVNERGEERRIFKAFDNNNSNNHSLIQQSSLGGILFGLRILFGISFAPLFSIFLVIITKSSIHLFFLLNRNNFEKLDQNRSFFLILFWAIKFGVQLFIFVVLCFLLTQLLNSVTVFWFDFFSKDEHPRFRRAVSKLNLESIFPSFQFLSSTQVGILFIMTLLPFITKLFFNGLIINSTTRSEDVQFANSMINGVIILLELALLTVLLSLERIKSSPSFNHLILPIIKSIFLIGSFMVASFSSNDSSLIISGARTIIVFCFLFTMLIVGWLLLKAVANFRNQFVVQFQNKRPILAVLLGISFFILVSLILKRPIEVLFFASIWVITFKYGIIRRNTEDSTAENQMERERTIKRKQVDYIIFMFTTFFYGFFLLILVVLLGTFFQETKGVTSNSCSLSFEASATATSSSPFLRSKKDHTDYGYPICKVKPSFYLCLLRLPLVDDVLL
eukprot:TRINITY_DN4247_c0_g1_i4.p1 TRINITY_DN4247_c0_g1~~TRINITY_DN4247_c0_g1_i4.p1  ORF type:complete len:458 (+),score=130.12 TRINITY_DN4247_c0_g1_i4:90-1463(+)